MSEHDARGNDLAPPPDELTRLLRDADPAGGVPDLDPIELANIRAAVTKAADDRAAHPRAWIAPLGGTVPALAAAATGVVALGLWFAFGPPAGAPPANIVAVDAAPSATATGETPGAPTGTPSGATEPMPTPPLPQAAIAAPDPATMVAAAATPGAAVPAAADEPVSEARTVQFTAPRGTRIIWTLDPDFESPISGQDARQEESK